MTRLSRIWIVLAVLALVAAACGGGESSEPETTAATTSAPAATTAAPGAPATTAPTQTTAAPSATTSPPDESSNGGGGGSTAPNRAIVTLDGNTHDFDVEQHLVGRCDPNFFGAFWVLATSADGSGDAGLEMFIVPDGDTNHNETSRVRVGLEDRDWSADEDGGQGVEPGESGVLTVEWDGNTVRGTAKFVDLETGDRDTTEGTFEATCP